MRFFGSIFFLLTFFPAALSASAGQLVASYVPQSFGTERVELVSETDDPDILYFYYDEYRGSFEHRPGGACQAGPENPTYLKLRYEGKTVLGCTVRASWDSQPQNCSPDLVQKINNGEEFVINTDYFLMDPANCGLVQPLTDHVQPPVGVHYFRLSLDLGKQTIQRRIRFQRLYPTSWAEEANARLRVSYVPYGGPVLYQMNEEYTSDDPAAFSFYYQEAFGHFHRRDPGGTCTPLLQNPTYLYVQYLGSRKIDTCTYQASWDAQSQPCSAALIWNLNHGYQTILNTDDYDINPSTCQQVQPPSAHLLSGVPAWMHLSIWSGGELFERRINFVKQ